VMGTIMAATTGIIGASVVMMTLLALPVMMPGLVRGASANETVRHAAVGANGMSWADMSSLSRHKNWKLVAVCGVDRNRFDKVDKKWPDVAKYADFRKLLDKEHKNIDAVTIGIPDHMHATTALACMQMGTHVYLEKPLTRTPWEARLMADAATKYNVATQMGNQGRSTESIRVLKEWIDFGAIGNVREVHAWTDRPVGGDPWSTFPVVARPEETPEVPEEMDWDLWLGPARYRPYHPIYHPMTWRAFYEFGTGPLGDMGCHILDPSFYVLELGAPETVEATSSHWEEDVRSETYPRASLVRYRFPARNGKPPVTINWYDGHLLPFRPKALPNDVKLPTSGAIMVGDEGVLVHGSHGGSSPRVYPDSLMKALKKNQPPKTIPRVKGGHESDWIRACKTGEAACSNFDYGAGLTEMVLLGVAAIRVPDQRLEWNADKFRFENSKEANALLDPPYRKGWKL